MNILEVLAVGLKAEGFDGLVVPGVCGCLAEDLSPGGCLCDGCEPGYKHTHSTSGEWIVKSKHEGITDDEIAETVAQCGWRPTPS